MTKHSYFSYTSTYISTRHNTNWKHNIHHTTCTNIQHTSTHQYLKHSIFNNGRYKTIIPTDPHTVTTTDIKTNMRYTYTSIVSMHLATNGNNKILRTPPPHIISSEEILPRLTRRTIAQLRANKSPFLKSYYIFICFHSLAAVGEFGSRSSRSGFRRFMASDDNYNVE